MASLARNAIANYLGQGYTTLIGIFMLPFYLKYLGAEAFGLVGFFSMLQAWFTLMDVGLAPTLARQVAHVRGQAMPDWAQLRSLLRSIEVAFTVLALTAFTIVAFGSSWVADHWLKVQQLPIGDVAYCLVLMGGMLGLRAFASLFRGGIQGMEKMEWLNVASGVIATVRFVGAVGLLHWVTRDVRHFFQFQLGVGVLEVLLLGLHFYRELPAASTGTEIKASWVALKKVLPFAGGLAYTTALWIVLTQADKLILSNVLSLSEYAYFALVAVVANGLFNLTGPISQAILPRMTLLFSQGKSSEAMEVYHRATQVVSAVLFPIIGFVAVFAHEILLLWTGDAAAAEWAAPLLPWFLAGNALLCVGAFPYYLQNALGDVRLHVINSSINAFLQLPIIVYAATVWGAMGVAQAWLILRVLTFLIFPTVVHRRHAPAGYNRRWFLHGMLPFVPATIVVLAIGYLIARPLQPEGTLLFSAQLALGCLLAVSTNLLLVKEHLFRK
jgi:O-antigen/teichoic acid export membrane protein